METRTDVALAFLRRWSAEWWLLSAIDPDKRGGIDTACFTPDEEPDCRRFLERHGRQWNIYFSVNPPRYRMQKKAERGDIARVEWLHVDVDPRIGEDLVAEQARILALFRKPPDGIPAPSAIIFSGGGYQAFWRLAEPIVLATSDDLASATSCNLRLEQVLGGDHCHNIDRIMRVPGTVNRPGEVKRKKGRAEVMAELVELNDISYPFSVFRPAMMVQDSEVGFGGNSVKISGNIARLASLDELPKEVDDYTRVVIVHGEHPLERAKFPSRSEWLFFVCCSLVRAGCTDETVYAIITDPQWKISSSVLDKRGRSDRYARRQIERAREEAIDPQLRELNERHAVISDIGGRCRIVSEVYDPAMKRPRVSRSTFQDFEHRYANRRAEIGRDPKTQLPVTMPLGKWWIHHKSRRQYETITFAPGLETDGSYNLWRGYGVEARPGDCSLFLRHVREVVCSGDERNERYLLDWMAAAVQRPDQPGRTAVVLKGRMGTGKSVFARVLGSLFGRHFLPISDAKHLVGPFNSHLRDCVLLFADEAFGTSLRDGVSTLKALVTEETLVLEAKGVDVELAQNCVHLVMASDEGWAVPVGLDDRRFFVLDVSDQRMQDRGWFDAIMREANSGGREALLHFLLARDLSKYEPYDRPKTDALATEKVHSLDAQHSWWLERLIDGKLCETHDAWCEQVICAEVHDDFIAYCRRWSGKQMSTSPTRLGIFLGKVCPSGYPSKKQVGGTRNYRSAVDGQIREVVRPTTYVFPTLDDCRTYWDERFGKVHAWSNGREPGEDDNEEPQPF